MINEEQWKYRHPGGRPSKFNPELANKLVEYISNRVPYKVAATAVGITERIFYKWLNEGKKDIEEEFESEKAKFFHALKKAECDVLTKHLDNINEGVDKWQSQAWILERRWNEHFGSNQVIEINRRLDDIEFKLSEDK